MTRNAVVGGAEQNESAKQRAVTEKDPQFAPTSALSSHPGEKQPPQSSQSQQPVEGVRPTRRRYLPIAEDAPEGIV